MVIRIVSFPLLFISLAASVTLAGSGEYSRLARVSLLEGNVSFQHPNEVDWTAASLNIALQPEDRIYTGDSGRAEIQFDDGSAIRLAEKTDVEILALNDNLIQIRILTGLCSLTVHSNLRFEINTPAAAFSTLKKGAYRFDVTESGDTDGIVRKGRLEAANNFFIRELQSGELIHLVPGGTGNPQLSLYDQKDMWDEWSDRRDAEMLAYDSRRYLPDTVYMGVKELDTYGRWVDVDSYGPAWIPYAVDAAWSPYWVGHWWYRPSWGWTWVSYEPWGWLPYHYGRWYHHSGFGWCWLPGASFTFNFWSPALVRFYHGSSWVSWCPLGPGDYYNVNNYYYNNHYSHQINNLRLIQNRSPQDLINRNAANAFRTISISQFTSTSLGGTDRHSVVEIVDQPWRRGRLVMEQLPVEPTLQSYSPAPGRPSARPSTVRVLPAIVRTAPAGSSASSDRFVQIGGAHRGSGAASRSVVVGAPAEEGSGRSIGFVPPGDRSAPVVGRGETGSSIGTVPAGSVNRRSERSESEIESRGRIFQGNTLPPARETIPRIPSRESPGGRSVLIPPSPRRTEIPPANPGASGRQRMGSPGPENVPQRRMEPLPPTPAPAPQPRIERAPAPPRSQPERSRPPQSSQSSPLTPRVDKA